jgi:nicotinate dehydrogenase subunit A
VARTIALRVNGVACRVTLDPTTPLVYVLRNDLGLVGTRHGCDMEQCGACRVLVDGVVRPACQLALEAVEDRSITTVEHATDPVLDSLRRAFVAEQAAQCGACSSGMLITAAALLADTRLPDEETVRRALRPCLCRCGSHQRIVRAIVRAARELEDD